MNGNKLGKHKQISIIALIITIIVLLFSYLQFDDYRNNISNYNEIADFIKREERVYIKTLLNEEDKLTEKSLNLVLEDIQHKLALYYGKDLEGLDKDIDNPTSNSRLTKVFNESLGDFYINQDTTVNRPIVLSMKCLLWGNSLSYDKAPDEVLSIETLLRLQGNSKLNKEAIETILRNDNSKYIFWENKNHGNLKVMDIDKLIDIYSKDGLSSMKNYELLVPVYITKDGDIFGIKDTDGLGHKVDNYKMVIVQRINIYDLLKEYSNELSYYTAAIGRIHDKANANVIDKSRSLIMNVCILALVLFGSAYLQNKKYK